MEVSDIKGARSTKTSSPAPANAGKSESRQRAAQSLTSTQIVAKSDSVSVSADTKRKSAEKNQARNEINKVIDVINVADEATAEIEKIVKSIGGIVSQAEQDDLTAERRAALQKEANDLVDEIRKKSQSEAGGIQPLRGQEIRLEIEENVGRPLEVIFPNDAESSLGLGSLEFSQKDSIVDVRTSVAFAKERIEGIRSAVSEAKSSIASIASSFDIAQQNVEASETSLRDLDNALEQISKTRKLISSDPDRAVDAVGELRPEAAKLLD